MPNERPYSKREMDSFFKNASEKTDAWFATVMAKMQETHKERTEAIEDMRKHEILPILEQTTRTNGRVSKLETRADRHEKRWVWLTGAAFILVPVFLSVCSWVVLRQLDFDKDVQSAVDAKFESYEVTGTVQLSN